MKKPLPARLPDPAGSGLTTESATVRCGMSGHAGANDGQIVLNKDSSVLDRVENGQKKFSQSVHTQEVTGSSPVVSTIKTPEIARFLVFLFVFRNFSGEFKLAKNARPHKKPQLAK